MKFNAYIRLTRPQQWVKNVFVLMPAFFAGTITHGEVLSNVLIAFAMFCLASSAVYCINDLIDAESDRNHPTKCNRPIASGRASKSGAGILAFILALASLAGTWLLVNISAMWVIAAYLAMNVLYTTILKRFALIDISIVALGYVLRLVVGSIAANCALSSWIVVIAFMLCVFLVLGKRREDSNINSNIGERQRPVYSLQFIDIAMSICCSIVIAGYLIYSIIPNSTRVVKSSYFYITTLPVIIGLLRYLQICITTNSGGSHTTVLFRDGIITGSIILYLIIYIALAL